MAKIDFPNVVIRRVKGRVYHYYRTRKAGEKDQLTRLHGEPGSRRFIEQYERLHGSARAVASGERSFCRLITSYLQSGDFAALSARSQRDYQTYLRVIEAAAGELNAAAWSRQDVLEMRDHYAATPRKAKYLVQIMSILMRHAIDKGWRADNPAERVRAPKTKRGFPPWPAEQIAAILSEANGVVLLGIRVALAIGPRPGDLVNLRWADVDLDDAVVTYTQTKTGERSLRAAVAGDDRLPESRARKGARRVSANRQSRPTAELQQI